MTELNVLPLREKRAHEIRFGVVDFGNPYSALKELKREADEADEAIKYALKPAWTLPIVRVLAVETQLNAPYSKRSPSERV